MPKPSSRTASHNGRSWPAAFRRARSQPTVNTMAAISAVPPDHFVAVAAPRATPQATRHGRKTGAGGRSGGRSRPGSVSASMSGSAGIGAGCFRSIHRRSSTRNSIPATTKRATKMSSMEIRDWTKFRFSVARSMPATPAHNALWNRT